MQDIITHIKFWLFQNRPDLKQDDRESIAVNVYENIKSNINNLEAGARIIFLEEYLILNYLKSAYNLVKDVFEENFKEEFIDYQKTPIFFEINEDILLLCIKKKIIKNYNQIFNEDEFYNNEIRNEIKNCIKEII